MTYQTLIYTVSDDVAVITLNRPSVMNALTSELRRDMLAALREAETQARVLVLTGAGRAFCSGQDLAEVDIETVDLEAVLRDEYEPLLTAIAACPLPVIAAVNGAAAGAGAGLALACDVVIAAESASFIQAFTRIGLVPDAGGSYWLPRQIGLARAMGAMLFAETVTARQAADWGMIWEAVPDDTFAAHWRARALALACGPSPAYRGVKQALRASFDNDFAGQLALEARLQGTCARPPISAKGLPPFWPSARPGFRAAKSTACKVRPED